MQFIRFMRTLIFFMVFGAVFLSGDSVFFKNLALKAQNYNDKEFYIIDTSEMTVDGSIAIAITFSTPLEKKQNLDKLISIYNEHKKSTVDGSWELSENGQEVYFKYLDPNTKYSISISAAAPKIKNVAKKELNLNNDYKVSVTTQNLQPMVGFSSSSSLLASDFTEGLPVMTLNVDAVDLDFFRVDLENLPYALNYLFGSSSIYTYNADEIINKGGKLVYSGRFNLNPKKNVRDSAIIPIKNIKELQNSGVYIAIMRQSGQYYNYYMPATIFSITNIGVIAHKTRSGYEVFTQNLLDGNVLPNVDITVIDQKGKAILKQQRTDKSGYLKIPIFHDESSDKSPAALIAQSGNKTSFISLKNNALDLSESAIYGSHSSNKTLFVFGPRDLYRNGEKVFVNAILRDSDGKMVADQPIQVDIIQGVNNKIVRTFTWKGKDGFYQYEYDIPQDAPTGSWYFKFNLGGDKESFYDFAVEDFMPEKMALEVTPMLNQDNVIFDVYGKYLYGAPAAGNLLTGNIYSTPLRKAVENLPGFYFGSIREDDLRRYLENVEMNLNEDGKAAVNVGNFWSDIKSPINILFEASLMESGGRPITRTAVQSIWPSSQMPAIKPNFSKKRIYGYSSDTYDNEFSVDHNSKAEFEIVFTNKDGEKLAKENLQVNLIKERRDYYWYWSDSWRYDYRQKDIPLEKINVSLEKGKSATVSFDVEWGPYVVEVIDKDTGSISSVRFWAGYSWQENGGRIETRPEQVKLKIDKPSYKVGDIAKVTVESPEGGNGYLIVESNDGILWWKSITISKEGTVFDIPITWARHDIYIEAVVIRSGSKKLHSTPKRAIGLLHLPLFRDDRKLDVKLQLPNKIEPNSKAKIHVKANLTQAQKGRKVMAVVSAVDSGILNITDFQTPDPFNVFFAKRWLDVDIYDIYGNLIEGSGKTASLKFGGDMALTRAGKKPVSKVLLVTMQSEPITLDSNGEADISFDIPDFNGELRFMAQVWSEEDYGAVEEKAIVALPLVAELNHPRFLGSGDKSTLALDLNNLLDLAQDLKINVRVSGFLSYDGSDEYKIHLPNKQKKVIYLPISAKSGFGDGNIAIKISGTSGKDVIAIEKKWTIGVRPPYTAKSFNILKTLNKNDVMSSDDFNEGYKGLDERSIEAKVTLSAAPPLNLAEAISELFAYPYGCLEQTTSGIYPSIYVSSDQLKAFGIKTSNDTERRKSVEKGIERLVGMQKTNGSFGFWGSDDHEAYWVTVYVTDFLLRANEQGYYVPQNTLKSAIERLQYYSNSGSMDNGYTDDRTYTNFAVRSYAALVLAREQKANLGNLRKLYGELTDNKTSSLALMQLGIALKLMGDNEKADELFKKSLSSTTQANDKLGWYGDYGSDLRDKALILSLLHEHNLLPNERIKLLLDISAEIQTQRYFSTQERNAIFLAGRYYMNLNEPNWHAVIDAKGKKEDVKNVEKMFVRKLDFVGINAIQSIKNFSNTTLFSSIDIVGYPKTAPKPVYNNVSIKRSYYTLDGKEMTLSELKSGDLVVVRLDVSTKLDRLPDALVVDLLPAGLELENQNLGHSSVNLQNSEALSRNSELMNKIVNTTVLHQEFRDDRYVAAIDVGLYKPATLVYLARAVTPGTYAVPPPYVESMYRPSFFSIGETVPTLKIK